MELIITNDNISAKEEFNLEDLPLASSYAKEATANQRKRINEIILAGMEKSNPAIELPFELFPNIQDELRERGWVQNSYYWYQPIWRENPLEVFEIKDDAEKIISAKVFYDTTMKQQLGVLSDKFETARQKGLAVISLDFPLYKLISGKLLLRGWHVFVNNEYGNPFLSPSTTIKVK